MADQSASYRSILIVPGISLYQSKRHPYWLARVWDAERGRHAVQSTRMVTISGARKAALKFARQHLTAKKQVPREYKFTSFSLEMLRRETIRAHKGERSIGSLKAMRWCIEKPKWGLVDQFGDRDVREISTADFVKYMDYLEIEKPNWTPSTKNLVMATFRNCLKVARDTGAINTIPETPRRKEKDNPRPFFKFDPIISKEEDELQRLLTTARQMVFDRRTVRWLPVTEEFPDILEFIVLSFVRPITSELYALRHKDIVIATKPKRLILTIQRGKTGFRMANTMAEAVDIYERQKLRYPSHKPDDFIFYPEYENRITAGKNVQRQFKELMKGVGISKDQATGKSHTIYSLRHTAICQRIICSEGKVNIFNLAKNAGTSVEQIERFYARHLPLTAEMARNLQITQDD